MNTYGHVVTRLRAPLIEGYGGQMVRDWDNAERTEVAAIAGTRISLTLTGSEPAIRYAQVGRGDNIGGGAVASRWQVECWGKGGGAPDDGTAGLLARRVVRLVPKFVGSWAGANVSGASADAPYPQPDPTTGRPRHIVEVSFIAAP